MRRRKNKNNLIARVMRIVVLVRLALQGFRIARKVHRLRRVIFAGAVAALVGLIVRRRRASSAPDPMLTYAPPPTPAVPPATPPLDAGD